MKGWWSLSGIRCISQNKKGRHRIDAGPKPKKSRSELVFALSGKNFLLNPSATGLGASADAERCACLGGRTLHVVIAHELAEVFNPNGRAGKDIAFFCRSRSVHCDDAKEARAPCLKCFQHYPPFCFSNSPRVLSLCTPIASQLQHVDSARGETFTI